MFKKKIKYGNGNLQLKPFSGYEPIFHIQNAALSKTGTEMLAKVKGHLFNCHIKNVIRS